MMYIDAVIELRKDLLTKLYMMDSQNTEIIENLKNWSNLESNLKDLKKESIWGQESDCGLKVFSIYNEDSSFCVIEYDGVLSKESFLEDMQKCACKTIINLDSNEEDDIGLVLLYNLIMDPKMVQIG